jgi:hypothetical protein
MSIEIMSIESMSIESRNGKGIFVSCPLLTIQGSLSVTTEWQGHLCVLSLTTDRSNRQDITRPMVTDREMREIVHFLHFIVQKKHISRTSSVQKY